MKLLSEEMLIPYTPNQRLTKVNHFQNGLGSGNISLRDINKTSRRRGERKKSTFNAKVGDVKSNSLGLECRSEL